MPRCIASKRQVRTRSACTRNLFGHPAHGLHMRDLWLVVLVVGCSAPRAQITDLGVPLTAASSSLTTPAIERGEVAPWSLTASDGSGLALTKASVNGIVDGPLAYTELELYFHN